MPVDPTAIRYITAYFDELDAKVDFLLELAQTSHMDEARTLCLVYLDGISNWLSDNPEATTQNFVEMVVEYGGQPELAMVLPRLLLKSLPWGSAPSEGQSQLRPLFEELPQDAAYAPADMLNLCRESLSMEICEWLGPELWRGTVARAVHQHMRSNSVHFLGSASGLSFSETRIGDREIPVIDFRLLHRVLVAMAAHARELSIRTGTWFGQLS